MKSYLYKSKGLLLLSVLLISGSEVFSIYLAKIFGSMVDAASKSDWIIFKRFIFLGILFVAVDFFISVFSNYILNLYSKKTMATLKNDIMNSILDWSIFRFRKTNTAAYISILNNDVKMFQQYYVSAVPYAIARLCSLTVAVILLVQISPIVAIVVILVNFLPFLVPTVIGDKLSRAKTKSVEAAEKYNIDIKDIFSGFEAIKSMNVKNLILKKHRIINNSAQDEEFKSNNISTLSWVMSMCTTELVVILTLIITTFFVLNGKITVGAMIMSIQLANQVVNPVLLLSEQYTHFKEMKDVNKRIQNVLCAEPDVSENKIELTEKFDSITLNDVSFTYNGGTSSALQGISLKLEKGKKYALIGRSGSGKSTLLKLLQGYYEDYTGDICINGRSISDLKKECIFKYISVIQQDVFLFDDSLKNNITLYQNYTDDDINKAIANAGLSEKVLENGLDYHISEGGGNLSGGEKQRIALARASIRKTPILILDEATANLDNIIEEEIYTSVLKEKETMSIVVTHKLNDNILKQMDKIIVMKNGRVAECDTFENLYNKGGEFYNIYKVYN